MTNQLTLNTNPFTGNQSDDIGRICVDYNADGSMSFDAHSQKRVEVDGEKINIGNLELMYSQSYASYEELVAKAANLILVSEGAATPEEIQEALSGNNAETMSAIEEAKSMVNSAFELITKLTKYAASQASVKEEISEDIDV